MRNTVIALALAMIASLSFAKNNSNDNGPTFGGNTTVNADPSATAGAAALSLSSADASASLHNSVSTSVRNDVSSTNLNSVRNDNANVQGQHQGQGQHQAAVSSSGGNKLTNEGNNAAQVTNVSIGGDVTESNTPPVMPGVLPSVPTSCRLYLFGGGSTRDGAGSGTFPIGNDQTCLSIAKINLMERIGGFTQAEKQVVACKVEGMSELETCKALAK